MDDSRGCTISWCGPAGAHHKGSSGEFIYDSWIIDLLSSQLRIIKWAPASQSRLTQLRNLIFGVPWLRHRYKKSVNRREALNYEAQAVGNVISCEPFDFILHFYKKPTILIMHNITSDAIVEAYPNSALVKFIASICRAHEKKLFQYEHLIKLVVLSERDKALVTELAPHLTVITAPPGMPELQPLDSTAVFCGTELVLSGTYDWRAKKRDCIRLLEAVKNTNFQIASDDELPASADTPLVIPADLGNADANAYRIRIGVIPDTFLAGHKLKSTFLISNNCMIVSFCDLSSEFKGIANSQLFVRQIDNVLRIPDIVEELSSIDQATLFSLFRDFQLECRDRFCWQRSSALISEELTSLATS